MLYESRDKNDPQGRTKEIIRQDIEQIKAYEDAFDVPMFDVDADGNVSGLPAPYPREVAGVVRGGYRIYELGQNVYKTGIPCLNPILGRNSAEETWKESKDIYKYAEKYGQTIFQFVHSEATRHIDPLKGRELIDQSRGKGGITPKGEREFVQMGGGAKHPVRINATGDTAHINILNGFIAGFDGTDIGPVIHVHFGGRGIHDFRTKVLGGYKACIVCAENKIFAQLDTHKHINNIGGTDGMAIAMCLLSEGIATHAGLPWELSAIQMNVGGVNLYRDLAIMRSFRHNMLSKGLIVVPETFQNPPANLIAEQAHFARMAISAKLGQANYYRPKAAESVGIPTGDSMGQACWATLDVFNRTYNPGIESPIIDEYERVMMDEAYAVLEAVLHLPAHTIKQGTLTEEFWKQWSDEELIDLIVEGGKTGIMDTPRAGGWDLKRFVKTHRDVDGITRYVEGYTPFNVDPSRCPITKEMKHEDVPVEQPPTRPEKIVLATVGADAHVNGINTIRETFQLAGYEVIFLRGMNLPETVAEVAAEAKADAVGVSNLLGLGVTLFPRVSQRLEELGIRDKVVVWSGGRIAEKEEEHAYYEEKIAKEGTGFMGVDAYFGPDSTPEQCLNKITELLEAKKANK